MRFMNTYDVEDARVRFRNHPVLGPATRTLANLRDAADANSDGWAYWPKPARAAAKLMQFIERDGTARWRFDDEREDATAAELRKAYAPIKAFRTRSGIHFDIEEPGDAFFRGEVSSIYVERDGTHDRFIVSLIVGYSEGDGVTTPEAAAKAALDLTRDSGQEGTHWFVYDRHTQTMHTFEQGDFDVSQPIGTGDSATSQ